MIKTVLLHAPLHLAGGTHGPSAAAVALAAGQGASVTALLFDYQVVSGSSVDPDAAAQALNEMGRSAGVPMRVISSHSHAQGIHEVVADHARVHDLVVAGADRHGLLPERQVTEYLLFQGGRPLLLVPAAQHSCPARRIAVAWDGSRAAARAAGDALPLLSAADDVALVHVADDKDLEASLTPDETVEAFHARGVKARFVQVERGSRPIAQTLAEEALGLGADVLVMGAYSRKPLAERLLGGATHGTLEHPRLPTLLSF